MVDQGGVRLDAATRRLVESVGSAGDAALALDAARASVTLLYNAPPPLQESSLQSAEERTLAILRDHCREDSVAILHGPGLPQAAPPPAIEPPPPPPRTRTRGRHLLDE